MMHPLPHAYHAQAHAAASGSVLVGAAHLPDIETDAPPEFGGPQGCWSPETLLVASIANCYVLSFRAVARASKLEWQSLGVSVEGRLEREDGVTRFTRFTLAPRLVLPAGSSQTLAAGVLKKAKTVCLVTNSLTAQCDLAPEVVMTPAEDADIAPA